MTIPASIGQWLEQRARGRGAAPAILAPGRASLSYAGLRDHAAQTGSALRRLGVGPGDPVALILPNGPEMATAVVAIAASAACAPLNPDARRAEIEFCLRDLGAKAVVVDEDAGGAAVAAAASAGVRVLRLRRTSATAGVFELGSGGGAGEVEAGDPWAGRDDVALLLHTSGTTSRPKRVPLLGRNLLTSARNISRTLALGPDDCCLNIMPLFHVHGLMAAVLATLDAGGAVVCTDGAYGARFFERFEAFWPTWYTAVPAMHQAVLSQARDHRAVAGRGRLRLVRSSSAPLPPRVLGELEALFGAPAIEAYGMTEATHQVASNPMPPAARKPGSVGPAAGAEIAVIDEAGRPVPPGTTGEVVIRGDAVTPGYAGDAAASEAAFVDGWFRTGDQGRIDEGGYLYLTGRLKELINRGGEKISPREVDEVLLRHPAVREALAFAVPHHQLGEEVGAAVALTAPGAVDEGELRRHAAGVLPAFKTPRVIRIVDAIPKGATGKSERVGMAARLGIAELDAAAAAAHVEPRDEIERRVAALWQRLLHVERVGVRDRFAALGGDSLLAVRMLLEVSEAEGVGAAFARFLDEGTVEAIAAEVAEWRAGRAVPGAPVAIQSAGSRRPLFCIPGHDGTLMGISRLARALGPDQPVWAFPLAEPADSIADVARRCVERMSPLAGGQPHRLAGVCFGGLVALEMARQLREAGEQVELVALIDTLNPAWRRDQRAAAVAASVARQLRAKVAYHATALRGMGAWGGTRYLAGRARAFLRNHGERAGARALRLGLELPGGLRSVRWAHRRMALDHRPGIYPGDVLIVKAPGRRPDVPALGWRGTILGILEEVEVPFHPTGALAADSAARVAEALSRRLR